MHDAETREAHLQEQSARGDRFDRFWKQENLDEVSDTWERTLLEALLKTDARQDEERRRLQTAILQGRKFREHFRSVVQGGEMARKELEEIKSGRRPFF